MIFFLLNYNKIHKAQHFCALDIVESHSKDMYLVSYVTCVGIIAQLLLLARVIINPYYQ